MRFHVSLLIIVFLSPSLAAGQSTTADGIRALARGDAAAAVRILQPLAEGSEPDPIAQFFLATLYDTGSGVARDYIRACGLYRKVRDADEPALEAGDPALRRDSTNWTRY